MSSPYTTPETKTAAPNSGRNLDHLANLTRHVNIALLLQIIALASLFFLVSSSKNSESPPILTVGVLTFGVLIYGIVSVFRLMKSINGLGYAIVLTIAMLLPVPLLSLLIIVYANSKATKILKDAGYKIGLLGAKKPA